MLKWLIVLSQVNFLAPRLLTGVITQGRAGVPSYVKTYKVLYSSDGFHWTPYQENGTDKVCHFRGYGIRQKCPKTLLILCKTCFYIQSNV